MSLSDHLSEHTTYSIVCDECGDEMDDGGNGFEKSFLADLKRDGWREINGRALCPECAKGESQ